MVGSQRIAVSCKIRKDRFYERHIKYCQTMKMTVLASHEPIVLFILLV